MNLFDAWIITFLNSFAQRWPFVDEFVGFVANTLFAKAIFVALFVWWPWCVDSDRRQRNREVVCASMLASFIALAAFLVIQKGLPYRVRPMDNPALHFLRPFGQAPIKFFPSSFPSDHALLFGTLAAGCWFVSPAFGIAANLFGFVFIGLPRVYLGFHYPTDIIGGAVLGILVGALANRERLRSFMVRIPMRWHERSPGLVSALLFVVSVQISNVFWEARVLLSALATTLGLHVRLLY